MHIGHFITDLNGRGGIETYVSRLGNGLSRRGHTVTYFGRRGTPTSDHIRVADPSALYATARELDIDVLHLHKAISAQPPADISVLRTVHDNGASCPSGSRYLRRTGSPCPRIASLPACLFGHYVDGCGSRRPLKVWENFQRLADNRHVLSEIRTVTVSQYVKDEMMTLGYPAEDLHVVLSPAPRGPSAPAPLSTNVPPRLLFVGRLVPEKGVDVLLRSIAALKVPIHLDIAGAGDHLAALEEQVTHLNLQDSVTFHGWVDGPALNDLFEAARAVVVPSAWHEPAGLVPLEAAARGRAVVASRVGGLPEHAHPSFSLLVPPNDETALTAALHKVCTDAKEASRLGQAGYAHVRRHHAMDDFLTQHEALYTALRSPSSYPVC